MNFPFSSLFIDIFFAFFILLMVVIGYFKGIVVRLYDLLATFVAIFLALFLSGPLSKMYNLYGIEDFVLLIGTFVNRLLIFCVIFVVCKVVFWIVGKFVRPLLKSLVSKIGFIKKFDRMLGAVLSVVEGCVLLYIALIIVISPIFTNGAENVENTVLAKHILNLVPSLSEEVKNLSENFNALSAIIETGTDYEHLSPASISSMASMINALQDTNILSDEYVSDMLNRYFDDIEDFEGQIVLEKNAYEEVQKMLNRLDDSAIDKEKIYEKIIVSE